MFSGIPGYVPEDVSEVVASPPVVAAEEVALVNAPVFLLCGDSESADSQN